MEATAKTQLPQIMNPAFVDEFERIVARTKMGPRPLPLCYRLIRKVEFDESDCWPVRGAGTDRGYRVIRIGSIKDGTRKQVLAHRISYEVFRGPIPDDLLVLHHCDNRPCINPSHLFLGTSKDNTQDMIAKDRSARSPIGRWQKKETI